MNTIEVTADYLVSFGQTLTFTDSNATAFRLESAVLTNSGDIEVSGSSGATGVVTVSSSGLGLGTFHNTATGLLNVSGDGAVGVSVGNEDAAVYNDGAIHIAGTDSAVGFHAGGPNSVFHNTGVYTVSAGNMAVGVSFNGSATFWNSGSILA